ncbi:MAG: hypothetical protein M0R37_03100 [Bacteroidales bacterium]|nr:hypothetical protein [Bacteroidales bacterium]
MRRIFFTIVLSLLSTCIFAQQQKQRPEESLVRLIDAKSAILTTFMGREFRKVSGPAQFLHNNALILCDSAIWDTQANIVDAIGNVKIIQKNTTLISDNIKYLADQSLAQVRGQLVELIDKEGGRLRTHYIDYYTKDSIGMFYNGGCLMNKDSTTIESMNGYYYSKDNRFLFQMKVEMQSDSVLMSTDSLAYLSKENRAVFLTKTYAWQGDGFLIANGGWYDRNMEYLHFDKDVYIKTKNNEIWATELDYDRKTGNAKLKNNAQILDTAQSALFFADQITYNRKPEKIVLEQNPSVATYSVENGVSDTLFFAADTITYSVLLHKEVDSSVVATASKRYELSKKDPISEMYAAKKMMGKENPDKGEKEGSGPADMPARPGDKLTGKPLTPPATSRENKALPDKKKQGEKSSRKETLRRSKKSKAAADTLVLKNSDTLLLKQTDSLLLKQTEPLLRKNGDSTILKRSSDTTSHKLTLNQRDSSITSVKDSLINSKVDSLLAKKADSTAINPIDTVKVKFLTALKNVRFHRKSLQGACDSLQFSTLDSLIRLYKDPLLWNENKQLSADSIQIVLSGRSLRKAELNSSAFVAVKEDSLHFDQIKGADIIIFFEKGELSRFDALGSASMLFFFAEDSVLTTMNEKECKAMSARLNDKKIERIRYFEQITSNAYPLFKLEAEKQKLKGFKWLEERRPKNRFDVCNRTIKSSQAHLENLAEKPLFIQNGIYFPKKR